MTTTLLLTFLGATLSAAPRFTDDDESAPARRVTPIVKWLSIDPIDLRPAAFAESSRKLEAAVEALKATHVDIASLRPTENGTIALPTGDRRTWKASEVVTLASAERLRLAYTTTRLHVDRFVECKLTVSSFQTLRVFVDGEQVATKEVVEDYGAAIPGSAEATLELAPGTHHVVVKSIFTPAGPEHWDILGEVSVAADSPADPPRPTITSLRPLSVEDLLDTQAVSWLSPSDNGLWLAIGKRAPEVPSPTQRRWIEIRDAETGAVVQTTEGVGDLGSFAWRPMSDDYAFVSRAGEAATVWLRSVSGGPSRKILDGEKKLGAIRFAPDGESLVFGVTEEAKKDDRGVKLMQGLADRWPGHRDHTHLHQIGLDGGVRRRLTSGDLGVSLEDMSPDGRRLLFTRTKYGVDRRPYSWTELWELDLETLQADPICDGGFVNGALYAPDGRIVVRAGRSFAIARGLLPAGAQPPNDYEGELYLRLSSETWSFLTASFAPSVANAAAAHGHGGLIITAEQESRRVAYSVELDAASFTPLPIDVDVVTAVAPARLAPMLAWTGSSITSPPTLGVLDAANPRSRTLERPGDETWKEIQFGEVRTWSWRNGDGDVVDGRIYLPPNFDPARKYPVIVYYYGGTSPINRSFGGRYPKNLWAAHGYVVYTMNPSGATGYGPEWSDRHVNDWGKTSSDEIIGATRAFLAAHAFADADRVGCIGASYGGFMTMLLLTRTDLFATGISHAGISDISSYWGEGFWGFGYSAVATADSFPWNRRDVYVDQSPLYSADKITSPLLLLHGTADTNVPIGESENMYTALRTLGKDVEFVRIDGENHHILSYPKRAIWMKTIVAWFDARLKGEAGWWDELYSLPGG